MTPQQQRPKAAQAQPAETKRESRGLFLQVPFYVIDLPTVSDNAIMAFQRFCRLFNTREKTVEFRGYYRRLAVALKKSPASMIDIVDQWVANNMVTRKDVDDGVMLQANLATLWELNKTHQESSQRSIFEQQSFYKNVPSTNPSVQRINGAVQHLNTTVRKINGAIQKINSSERDSACTRLLDITRSLDSFCAALAAPMSPLRDLDLLSEDLGIIAPVSPRRIQDASYSLGTTKMNDAPSSLPASPSPVQPGPLQFDEEIDEVTLASLQETQQEEEDIARPWESQSTQETFSEETEELTNEQAEEETQTTENPEPMTTRKIDVNMPIDMEQSTAAPSPSALTKPVVAAQSSMFAEVPPQILGGSGLAKNEASKDNQGVLQFPQGKNNKDNKPRKPAKDYTLEEQAVMFRLEKAMNQCRGCALAEPGEERRYLYKLIREHDEFTNLDLITEFFARVKDKQVKNEQVKGKPPRKLNAHHVYSEAPGILSDWEKEGYEPGSRLRKAWEYEQRAIDCAELAGIALEDRQGMPAKLAWHYAEQLYAWFGEHGYRTGVCQVDSDHQERGHAVEFLWSEEDDRIRFYHPDQWDDVIYPAQKEAPFGTPEFLEALQRKLSLWYDAQKEEFQYDAETETEERQVVNA